jgi:hypothetical protein
MVKQDIIRVLKKKERMNVIKREPVPHATNPFLPEIVTGHVLQTSYCPLQNWQENKHISNVALLI